MSGFLIATIGGFASVISLYVTSEIRSWDRMSIFIGFFALAAVGLLLDAAFSKMRVRQVGKFAIPLVLAVVLLAGLLDQTNKTLIPNYKAAGSTYLSDRAYFSQIEAELPKGSQVFELPLMQFPESAPINGVQSYDLLRPYLVTRNLRWSFGGIKGRLESTWQDRLRNMSVPDLLHALVATGFQGLYIDRAGYADNAASLESQISAELGGQQPLVGQNGMGSFFDLRAYGEHLKATGSAMLNADANTLLFPVYPAVTSHAFPQVEFDTNGNWRWADGTSGDLNITNSTSKPVRANVKFSLQSGTGQLSDFVVKWPDGSVDHVQAGGTPVEMTKTLTFKPEDSSIFISSNAPKVNAPSDSRDLHFRVNNVTVSPA
jgi:phosphoglycerol transferase